MSITDAIYDGPGRNYSKDRHGGPVRTDKRYIVIHNTSNDASDENEASYAKRRTDSVSSHYYVDGDSITQSLDTDWRAWHVGSDEGNDRGISYEITGTNGKSRAWWLSHVAWGPMVAQMRIDCDEHRITPRLLTVSQIRAGDLTGIITHDQARQAWGGTTHTDPGPGFPLDHLIDLLEDDMPTVEDVWGWDGIPAPKTALADDPKNTRWAPASYLQWTYNNVSEVRADQAAIRRDQAAHTALLTKLAASQSGLTAEEVAAAVETGVRAAPPSVEELAAAVAAAVDHDLDTAAVAAALREVLGGVDEAD